MKKNKEKNIKLKIIIPIIVVISVISFVLGYILNISNYANQVEKLSSIDSKGKYKAEK